MELKIDEEMKVEFELEEIRTYDELNGERMELIATELTNQEMGRYRKDRR